MIVSALGKKSISIVLLSEKSEESNFFNFEAYTFCKAVQPLNAPFAILSSDDTFTVFNFLQSVNPPSALFSFGISTEAILLPLKALCSISVLGKSADLRLLFAKQLS